MFFKYFCAHILFCFVYDIIVSMLFLKNNKVKFRFGLSLRVLFAVCVLMLCSCSSYHSSFKLLSVTGGRIEITSALDESPDSVALKLWQHYSDSVKAVMAPVIGHTDEAMAASFPESLLGNMIADVMLDVSGNYGTDKADMALLNLGAIRNSLPKGDITYGDIYKVFSFENRFCIVSLTGKQLLDMLRTIVEKESMAVAGVRLVADEQHKLIEAKISGDIIKPENIYRIATIDYLADGNSGMTVMKHAVDKYFPEGVMLRSLFVDYVVHVNASGKILSSKLDGRITVIHNTSR